MTAWQTADGLDLRDALTMQSIIATWGETYDVGFTAGAYCARRLTGGPLLTAATPAGLESAIRADYSRWASR